MMPARLTEPLVGASSPARMRASVVLPDPLWPTSPVFSWARPSVTCLSTLWPVGDCQETDSAKTTGGEAEPGESKGTSRRRAALLLPPFRT